MLNCANPIITEEDFGLRLDLYVAELKGKKQRLAEQRAFWDRLWKEHKDMGITLVGHTPTPSTPETS